MKTVSIGLFFALSVVFTLVVMTWASPSRQQHLDNVGIVVEDLELNTISTANNSCNRVCPRNLDPICAVDENDDKNIKYFHNACLMENDACRRGRAWKPTQLLQCITDIDPGLRDNCEHACPYIYDPVCARIARNDADGRVKEYIQIFGNRCVFDMENCLASGKWLEVRGEMCGVAEV
ncbi:enhancer of split M1 protein-like [Musca autumnalis]|uniref:enhancer of split M1 protein-like n=1 Tax=Musca autumnalis TaxID=221902 RepID=UPI003CF59163